MAVFFRNGNWWIDTYIKGKRIRRKIGPDKRTAELVEKDLKVKAAKGEYLGIVEERKIRFEDFAKEFLEWSEANKAPRTYDADRRLVERFLLRLWGGKYLANIRAKDVETFKTLRLGTLKPRSVNRELGTLRSMFTRAVAWQYIKDHPMKSVKELKYQKRTPAFLTLEQVDKLLEACEHPLLRLFVLLAAYTGMRRSEIEDLKWSDVDFGRKEIRVQEDTKNNEYRVIPIGGLVEEALRRAYSPFQEYVLSQENGRPYRNISKRFREVIKAVDVPTIRIHDLRHTFASNLVMGGIPLNVVQELLGHRDIKTTMIYAHLAPNAKRAAIDFLMSHVRTEGEECEKEVSSTG